MKRWRDLAEVLRASGGDVTEKGLRATGLGYDKVRWVVTQLEAMGLVQRVGPWRQRVLALPLAEAVQRLAGLELPPRVERRDKGMAHRPPVMDEMRLVYDPGRLFAPGAVFPANQVLPPDEEPDAWYIGTVFELRSVVKGRRRYVYDGEAVVEVDERERAIDVPEGCGHGGQDQGVGGAGARGAGDGTVMHAAADFD